MWKRQKGQNIERVEYRKDRIWKGQNVEKAERAEYRKGGI